MAKIKINDINYYYEEAGSGEPLLLIAGISCDVAVWASVMSKLSQNFRVIMFDNRDVGRTDYLSHDYTIDDMADDTIGLINTLGYTKVNILGHSMGGAIAQNIAYRYPDKVNKLIICNSLVYLSPVGKSALEFVGKMKTANEGAVFSTQAIAPWIYSSDFLSMDGYMDKLIELVRNYPFFQPAHGYFRQLNALSNFDSMSYLDKISHLTLIIAGAHDILTPLSQSQIMAKHIPNSQLVVLPGSHMPIIEIVPLFIKTINNFLLGN